MTKHGPKQIDNPTATTVRVRLHNTRYRVMRQDVDEVMARVTVLERNTRILTNRIDHINTVQEAA